jgi:hypothetical protein
MNAEARYAEIVEALRDAPGVAQSTRRGFSRSGLMVHDKLFATLRRGDLLLKLPQPRVEAIIAAAQGTAFDAGRGRPMKEWVTVAFKAQRNWLDLAREAMAFVASQT